MFTRCRRCRKKIPYGETYCEHCLVIMRKETKRGFKDSKIEATTKNARWQALRRKIIIRDGGICALCIQRGIIEYRKLQVHHIVKRTEDESLIYEPTNLITLCPKCHKEVENMSVEQQRALFNTEKEIHFSL